MPPLSTSRKRRPRYPTGEEVRQSNPQPPNEPVCCQQLLLFFNHRIPAASRGCVGSVAQWTGSKADKKRKQIQYPREGKEKRNICCLLSSLPHSFPESRHRTCVPLLIITYTHQGEKQNITTVPLAFMAHSLLHHIFLDQAPRLTLLSF
ncbi:hypothetical protein CDAR_281321 [Caerostris darwini]|uniref:Uncharacterized protein n=1 Tax=Caerostris darwini TaxID=1538125 RepID=A0AAV4WWG5_9ARAC|nr:hypothetical protein CDAR_281321 [Caerostris darwini]